MNVFILRPNTQQTQRLLEDLYLDQFSHTVLARAYFSIHNIILEFKLLHFYSYTILKYIQNPPKIKYYQNN